MLKIDLELFDLSIDRIKHPIEQWITITPTHIHYKIECYVDKQPNVKNEEYEVKENVFICDTWIFLKDRISGIGCYFAESANGNDIYDCWAVEIQITGSNSDLKLNFPTKEKAEAFNKTMVDYILYNIIPESDA